MVNSTARTGFHYLYRDAGNFKAYGTVLLEGTILPDQERKVRARLQDGEFFIAEQVNIPSLTPELFRWSGGPVESDHCWHEFVKFIMVDAEESNHVTGQLIAEFVSRFASIVVWDESLSAHS